MLEHHRRSIDNVARFFERQPDVLALLLGGSLAHSFETPVSDVDVMIVVADDVYADRLARFAFQDAQVLLSRVDGLPGVVAEIARYPLSEKTGRMERFNAQLQAWPAPADWPTQFMLDSELNWANGPSPIDDI